ncbi:MAG: DEAD/DEAH box helicase, partial [Candidatus Aenigmarchaeota archaeon]|nr:DEAD/DEAH box helicase [Candidatus Aenigmarchaeota archaeon]
MEKFRKLGIIEPILKVIEEEEFEKPTEIQEKSIPLVVSGKDVIAGSATGSGKTLAFGSGIIQNVEKRKGIGALVLAPTRELAEQVSGSLKKFAKYQPLNIVTVYGGVSIVPQTRNLRKADVVVGTPGRILDHISRRSINLSKVKILVLDEADRMLDMGFIDDVKKIVRECPSYRQTLLFSATISSEITKLAQKYMKTPVEISAKNHVDPTKLSQSYYEVTDGLKFSLLVTLLRKEKEGLVMVFCNTRRNVDFVAENLKFSEINAIAIHGGFSQEKRTKTMKYFNSKNGDVLV